MCIRSHKKALCLLLLLVPQRDDLAKSTELVERVATALIAGGLHARAGELYEKVSAAYGVFFAFLLFFIITIIIIIITLIIIINNQ